MYEQLELKGACVFYESKYFLKFVLCHLFAASPYSFAACLLVDCSVNLKTEHHSAICSLLS